MNELSLKVLTTNSEIKNLIMSQYAELVNNVLRAAYPNVKNFILRSIETRILTSDVAGRLIDGDLRQELGVVDGAAALAEIVGAIQNSAQFDIEPVIVSNDRIINGGYTIKILQESYEDILNLPSVAYASGEIIIPWLHWLLSAGAGPVVYGYRIMYNPQNPQNSRTGPIMVKSAGVWSVPSDAAGVQEDNFLTRALAGLENEIDDILAREIANANV